MADIGPVSSPQAVASASIIRGAFALLTTQPLTWAATLLATIIAPRFLGESGLGEYAVASSLAALALTVATLGLPSYLSRLAATRPERIAQETSAALVLAVALAATLAAVVIGLRPVLPLPITENQLLLLVLAWTAPSAGLWVISSALMGQQRYVKAAWTSALGPVLAPIAGVIVLLTGGDVVMYATAITAVTTIAFFISFASSGLWVGRHAFDRDLWRQLVRAGGPFLSWNVASRIRSESDRIVVGVMATAATVGWYAAAARIVAIPLFVPTLITAPLLPTLARHRSDSSVFRQTLLRALRATLLLTVPLSATIFAFAPLMPTLFGWGADFERSVPLIALLAVQQPVLVTNMVLGAALIALHTERKWLVVGVVGSILNPTLNILAVPLFAHMGNGAIGAALVAFATELAMLAGALYLIPRNLLSRSLLLDASRILLAGSSLVITIMFLQGQPIPVAAVAGVIVYIAVVAALGVASPADLRHLMRIAESGLTRRVVLP